jgi:hypothetical protein
MSLKDTKCLPPPQANDPPTEAIIHYNEFSPPDTDDYLIDANYPIEACL